MFINAAPLFEVPAQKTETDSKSADFGPGKLRLGLFHSNTVPNNQHEG